MVKKLESGIYIVKGFVAGDGGTKKSPMSPSGRTYKSDAQFVIMPYFGGAEETPLFFNATSVKRVHKIYQTSQIGGTSIVVSELAKGDTIIIALDED